MTRGEKVIAFIENYCRIPEGKKVGKPLILEQFQKDFILAIYDNPHGTNRAYLSIARKNGKSALIAAILLCHIVGCEALLNSQIVSGARSRDQAAIIYKLAEKMVRLNPELEGLVRCVPSTKQIFGVKKNVEFRALSAEAGTAHGLSPVLAILDEVGQVKGAYDAFIEAIETAQGAYDAPLLIAISTQAANDGDLFSIWLDDAAKEADPHLVCFNYCAPEGCALDDVEAWKAANPGLGTIRSEAEFTKFCDRAKAMPTAEQSFRWLYLNQRVSADAPFVSKSVWLANGAECELEEGQPVFLGIDLSSVSDLTAIVIIGLVQGKWHVKPLFFLPSQGLREKSEQDRVPYDVWHSQGYLETTHGAVVDYEFCAARLKEVWLEYDVQAAAFDRWNFQSFRKELIEVGFTEEMLEKFQDFGQGFKSMSPALRLLESDLLENKVAHGNHPLLTMCANNAAIASDAAGNRKLVKPKERYRRIDGMVALAMARGVATMEVTEQASEPDYSDGIIFV